MLGMLSLRRVAHESSPVTDPAMLQLARRLAARIGLRRSVRLVLSPRREIPMTWGVLRPVVLLPADAEGWSEERLTMALLHELAHVKRWDCLTQLVARATCAVYWFNPLSWLALARVRGEQEQASDDLALGCGLDRHSYADHLLAIVTGRASGGPRSAVALAMASSSKLERRLLGILDTGRSRREFGRRSVGLVTLASSAFLLPLAALRPLVGAESLPKPGRRRPGGAAPSRGATEAGSGGWPSNPRSWRRSARSSSGPPTSRRSATVRSRGSSTRSTTRIPRTSMPSSWPTWTRNLQGKVTGIGAQLELKDGDVTVVTPLPDSPAIKAGLRPGDVIEAGRRSADPGARTPRRWSSESSGRRARWCGSR